MERERERKRERETETEEVEGGSLKLGDIIQHWSFNASML